MLKSSSLPLAGPLPAVRSAVGAEQARLGALVRTHLRTVWRALRRLGVPTEALDDATQEVFMVALRKLAQIEPGKEQQFLYGTALRIASNARRAQATRQKLFAEGTPPTAADGAPSSDALLHHKRLRELLDTVLDAMPEELRTVFVLFELEGLSGPELGELLGVPVGTVASRLRRAREAFHEQAAQVRSRYAAGGVP
jgi:RNA polymerase sigma-70 factor, ECF subfamily